MPSGLTRRRATFALLDTVFGCQAERRFSLNATRFVRTIPGAVTRIMPVSATHQLAWRQANVS